MQRERLRTTSAKLRTEARLSPALPPNSSIKGPICQGSSIDKLTVSRTVHGARTEVSPCDTRVQSRRSLHMICVTNDAGELDHYALRLYYNSPQHRRLAGRIGTDNTYANLV